MKKILATALLVLALGLLTACGLFGSDDEPTIDPYDEYTDQTDPEDESTESEASGDEWHGGVTRGFWVDNMYVNEYLNLRFIAPEDWAVATDAEIAIIMNIGADFILGGVDDDIWDLLEESSLIDMMVSDPSGFFSVQVAFERLVFPMTRISASDYIQRLAADFENEIDMVMQTHISDEIVSIGDYEWESITIHMGIEGHIFILTYFINIQDGFVRSIIVSYIDVDGVVDFVLSSMSSLDESPPQPLPVPGLPPDLAPTPSPPAEPVDMAVVGAWVWDEDYGYIYEFMADGTGRRGWYPDLLEDFAWSTVMADNHLILHFNLYYESLTYTIVDDVITLDSRQVIGMSFNYVRWEGDFIETEPYEYEVDFTGHPLVGTWAWDADSSYIYTFMADGTGVRGFAGNRYDIFWYAYEDFLLMDVGTTMIEEWSFEIVDDVLTIVSLQVAGTTWSYVRQ